MSQDTVILHLSLIEGVGTATISKIVSGIKKELLQHLYHYQASDFSKFGISASRGQKIVIGLRDFSSLEKELALCKKYNFSWVAITSDGYPSLLKQIDQPPSILYYQGENLFLSDKTIAFVGARKSNAYARIAVQRLVPPLVEDDWTIVSGGAMGTDSFAHYQTVESKGKTIVVLGSGLLHWYPALNKDLFNKVVAAGGMIISSFSLQTRPLSGNFPIRNRIIAGLSRGTIVVQAEKKSGALITAEFALEQGREIFAVPGSIEQSLHLGCHALIQQGAKLVMTADDIVSELGYTDSIVSSEKINKNKEEDFSLLRKMVVPMSTEQLLVGSELSLDDLTQKLFDLSLEGKIAQDMMGLWTRI